MPCLWHCTMWCPVVRAMERACGGAPKRLSLVLSECSFGPVGSWSFSILCSALRVFRESVFVRLPRGVAHPGRGPAGGPRPMEGMVQVLSRTSRKNTRDARPRPACRLVPTLPARIHDASTVTECTSPHLFTLDPLCVSLSLWSAVSLSLSLCSGVSKRCTHRGVLPRCLRDSADTPTTDSPVSPSTHLCADGSVRFTATRFADRT